MSNFADQIINAIGLTYVWGDDESPCVCHVPMGTITVHNRSYSGLSGWGWFAEDFSELIVMSKDGFDSKDDAKKAALFWYIFGVE